MIKINYLNNKDLLLEIHKSKTSYSYFTKPEYSQYDAIVSNLADINTILIKQCQQKKTEIKLNEIRLFQKSQGKKLIVLPVLNPDDIDILSLVFRVMTSEHVPIEKERKTPKEIKVKCNFPPFKHYIITSFKINRKKEITKLVFEEVGRSHWKGGLVRGKFNLIQGKMTNALASMLMQLVNRYGQRGNWRGYCVDNQTEALTQRGWLGIDEITEDDIIMSYQDGVMKWSKIKSIYRDDFEGKMHRLTASGIDALVTPNHKFVTERGLVPVEELSTSDELILMGDPNTNVGVPKSLDFTLGYRRVRVEDIDFHDGKQEFGPNVPTTPYSGRVWCPETEFGCFLARRNDTVYLTGNSYLDEMKGQALLQLSTVALQFDESKSQNPFSYFTTIISNSYTRIFNLEKKNQNVRDDLFIMAGQSPSFTRQTEDSLAQRAEEPKE